LYGLPEASDLLKNSTLGLVLRGATRQRCDNRANVNAALAAEDTFSNRGLIPPCVTRTCLALIALALLSSYMLAQSAAVTYKEHCSACHAANGAGDTMLGKNMKLRSLASPEVQNRSDEDLFAIISKGKNRMPAYERKLSKQQIGDVVKYLRSLKK
jgi:mono/diheme cytochrome c family protein